MHHLVHVENLARVDGRSESAAARRVRAWPATDLPKRLEVLQLVVADLRHDLEPQDL